MNFYDKKYGVSDNTTTLDSRDKILQKFRGRMGENLSESRSKDIDTNTSPKKSDEGLKKERRILLKKIQNQELQLRSLKEDLLNERRKREAANKSLLETIEESKRLRIKNQQLESDLNLIEHQINSLKQQIENLSDSEMVLKNRSLVRERDNYRRECVEQKSMIANLLRQKEHYERENSRLRNTDDNHRIIKDLQTRNKGISAELQHFKNMVDFLKTPDGLAEILERVENYLVEDSRYYSVRLRKVLRRLKANCRNRNQVESRHLVTQKERVEELHGHACTIDDVHTFISIEGKSFPITECSTFDYDDTPVKAIIENGVARIVQTFTLGKLFDNNLGSSKKKRRKYGAQKSKASTPHVEHLRILMIGSQRKNQYLKVLSPLVEEICWFDPYEKNLRILRSKIEQFDVVLVCKQHIPHSVLNYVQKENHKFQLLGKDNIDIVIARIRFAAFQLGLMGYK